MTVKLLPWDGREEGEMEVAGRSLMSQQDTLMRSL
jgi:hypothetical protein